MALDGGKDFTFYSSKNVVAYSKLGIGRLIYQLPLPLCRMFIKEILMANRRMSLMRAYSYDNQQVLREQPERIRLPDSLHPPHTATGIYRLDKLQKSTGIGSAGI